MARPELAVEDGKGAHMRAQWPRRGAPRAAAGVRAQPRLRRMTVAVDREEQIRRYEELVERSTALRGYL